MDNEPSADLLPSKRPWGIWQWLLLLTPSLLMIVGLAGGIAVGAGLLTGGDDDGETHVLPAIVSLMITGPIAFILCILLTSKLVDERRSNAFLGLVGIVGINFAIASVTCEWIIDSL